MNSAEAVVIFSGLLIATLVATALLLKEPSDYARLFLFCGIAAATALGTIYLVAVTIAQNQASVTRGPVHWHADYEIFVCGQSKKDVDPRGLANRIGTPVLHEHGDNRVHVEGVVAELSEMSLGNFFRVIGGEMTANSLRLPTNDGDVTMENNAKCGNETARLQVFAYRTEGKTAKQTKLDDFSNYVLSPRSQIPPGDCLIIEFGPVKEKTDKLCNFYEIAIKKGELQRGY